MATDAQVNVTINGVTTAVKDFNDLAKALNNVDKSAEDLNSDLKKTAKEGSEVGKKVKEGAEKADKSMGPFQKRLDDIKEGFKGFFGDLKSGFQAGAQSIQKFAQGLGLGTKASKGLAVGLSALGIPLLIAAITALVGWFKNFEGAANLVQKALNVVGAVVNQLGKAFQALINLDFSGAVDAVAGIGSAAVDAASQTDKLFKAQKELFELTKQFTVENAQLRKEIEGQKKILEDSTLSYDQRLAALKEVNGATEQLARNQVALNKAQLAELQAQLALENNYEKKRELQQQIAETQAALIESETELNGVLYDAAKVERELQAEESARIEELRKQREEAAAQRVQNAKDVANTLEQLRLKTLTDEVEKIKATLLAEKEAAVESLREKGATEEQILQLTQYYDELEAQQLTAHQERMDAEKKANDEKIAAEKAATEQQELEHQRAFDDQLASLEITRGETIAQGLERERLAAIKNLDRQLQDGAVSNEEYQQLITATNEYYADQRAAIAEQEAAQEQALNEQRLAAAGALFGNIADLVGRESAFGKTAATAEALINTYLAAQKAYASLAGIPVVGPALGAVAAGVAIAAGLKNVKEIQNTQPPKAALGGMIVGPSHSQGGVPIEAEGGEFIINRAAMQVPGVASTAIALNNTARPKYANGGSVEDLQSQSDMFERIASQPIKTYVVATEVTSAQEANAQIENLSRL